MRVDILFADVNNYKPYSAATLGSEPLGGSEASTICVAEALANLGYKVAVVENYLQRPTKDTNVYYLPAMCISDLETDVFVGCRNTAFCGLFPDARKFIWEQDGPNKRLLKMRHSILQQDVTVIAVTKYHKQALEWLLCDRGSAVPPGDPKVIFIYNPVSDQAYIPRERKVPYDKNKVVWLSSPHRGLDKGIELFKRLVAVTGYQELQLHVFNPGYIPLHSIREPQVVVHGSLPRPQLWQHTAESLCLFFPCQTPESFGLVVAEANALHTPVAAYDFGSFRETISTREQLVPYNDEGAFISKVTSWYKGGRPEVYGQDRFKIAEVVKKWAALIEDGKALNRTHDCRTPLQKSARPH